MKNKLNKIKAQRRVLRIKRLARELQCRLDAKDAEAKGLHKELLVETATSARLASKLDETELKCREWRTKYDALYRTTFGSGIQNTESPRTVYRDIQIDSRLGVPIPAFMLSVKRVDLLPWRVLPDKSLFYCASMAIENAGFLTPFSMDMIFSAVRDMLAFMQNGGDK